MAKANYLCLSLLILLLLKCSHSHSHPFNILLPSDSLSSSSCPTHNPNLYYRPLIGILTHPGDGASGRLTNATDVSYIAASYVKFVESAGARVIPLLYNEPQDTLLKKLDMVNGVIFTGGWSKKGLYYDTVQTVYKKVLEKNDGGDYFPLYAISLGFELISIIISEDSNILDDFTSSKQPINLYLTQNAISDGAMFQRFPPDLLKKVTTDCLVLQNNRYGLSPEGLLNNEKLSSFFEILTTSKDANNKKNAFEWGTKNVPHTEDAVRLTQSAANFLVSEARKSSTRPDSQDVLDNLIYNYIPTYCGKAGKGYDQVYLFTQS
ncbi:gamma-glutamyl hydrolase 2-like [Senna tora]|uniref:folate gamma-glutamyl hydrolase n=1 Tax=Senna tora TaxID=362788 RepID=A0A834TIB1_9FABA|nr:gamma-glutamyl hydrolase 2-like [Senna tora]